MRKVLFILLLGVLSSVSLQAQESTVKNTNDAKETQSEALIYKFEPNIQSLVESREAAIKKSRAIIDTMQITDRQRRRLLKDLYKNGGLDDNSKIKVADTKFEEDLD